MSNLQIALNYNQAFVFYFNFCKFCGKNLNFLFLFMLSVFKGDHFTLDIMQLFRHLRKFFNQCFVFSLVDYKQLLFLVDFQLQMCSYTFDSFNSRFLDINF